jgi:hypothetical protein
MIAITADARRQRGQRGMRVALLLAWAMLATACSGGGGGGGKTDPGLPPPTNTVSGVVTFRGAPLAGVMVTAYSTNWNAVTATTVTDANGKFSFSGLEATADVTANFQFWPTLSGFAFYPSSAAGGAAAARAGYLWNPVPQNWYLPSGLSITRAGYNGAFASADGTAGVIFDVVNFMSALTGSANGSVSGADFAAYNGSNPLVALAATGQQTSYASGDDAALHAGTAWPAVRFVDNGDGTVTDSLTGLVWLRNAGCFTPTVWATAIEDINRLASGACGLTDGSSPGQWRLPNLVELESVVDASASGPAITAGSPFVNVSNGIYWSSTVYYGGEEGTTNAWAIRLADGRYMNDDTSNVMATSNNAVWAVKGTSGGAGQLQATGAYVQFASGDDGSLEFGAPLPVPRMVDNGDGTVTDTVTGLVWMKQADCINQPWAAAIAAVQALASGQCGLSDGSVAGDWRMPNRKEMQSLADRAQNNQADRFNETFTSGSTGIATQSAIFTNFVALQNYWTSTTNAANSGEAWTVFSCDFGVYDIAKSSTGYTLAVRGP